MSHYLIRHAARILWRMRLPWMNGLGLLLALLTAGYAYGEGRNVTGCASAAMGASLSRMPAAKPRDNGPLAAALLASPELIYSNGRLDIDDFPFFSSNEKDWHKTPWDTEPTDVLIGFGTNSAWDLAVRKNAKRMVIGDWEMGPLIAQRYLLRPIVKLAATPIEFLHLLFGLWPASNVNSLDQAASAVDAIFDKSVRTLRRGHDELLKRFKKSGASADELRTLKAHFEYLVAPPGHADRAGVLRGFSAQNNAFIGPSFLNRYVPLRQVENGAPGDWIARPNHSFLASQSAYDQFRELFLNRTQLALTAFDDSAFYRQLKAEGDAAGFTRYTFSISNILDAALLGPENSVAAFESYRQMIAEIFPEPKYEIVFFVTTNWTPPHGFLRLERHTPVRPGEWVYTPRKISGD